MEITGKLIQKLPVKSGVSSSGNNWSKAEFVIETVEQYPKKVCANLWGDRARALDQFQEGSLITVSFDLESREFNGNWYTDVRAWKVEPATPVAVTGAPAQGYMPQQPQYAGQQSKATEPCPPTNLVWAIISTLLCCLPAGVVAIVYAIKVTNKYNEGDIEGAKRASEVGAWWCIASIILGIIIQPIISMLPMMMVQ